VTLPKDIPTNPFGDDIVYDPRHIEATVEGLNDTPLDALIHAFGELDRTPRPRRRCRIPHTLVLSSPQAGYGKSHLVGRLFATLAGRATRVYVRPFVDPTSCWKSILDRAVAELDYPESDDAHSEITQLDELAHAFLALVFTQGHLKAARTNKKLAAKIDFLRSQPLTRLSPEQRGQWAAQVKVYLDDHKHLRAAIRAVRDAGLELHTPVATWLRVLYAYQSGKSQELRDACRDWLAGNGIDEAAAKAIGIPARDLPPVEPHATQLNQLCQHRLLDLCQLAAYHRPFLLCFDQTENYGGDRELATTLGEVIQVLTDWAPNQLTLLTTNAGHWEKLSAAWAEAHLHRLQTPFFALDGITPDQGGRLVTLRLGVWKLDEASIHRFVELVRARFPATAPMGIRTFLQQCRDVWQGFIQAPEGPPERLPALFAKYCDEMSAQPRRLRFDRDALYWLVAEVAQDLPGLSVATLRNRRGQAVPHWRSDGRDILFYLEAGTHWKTWLSIAQTSKSYCEKHPHTRLVCLRTPELRAIPGNWKSAGEIHAAQRDGHLHILVLTQPQLIEIYAARELYADAMQGDIAFTPQEVLDFLRDRLAPLWRQFRAPPGPAASDPPPPAPAAAEPGDLKQTLREVVEHERFLSIDELLERLPAGTARERVLALCGEMSQIHVHASPRMTVLQWLSAASA